jgi:hypothetical protein
VARDSQAGEKVVFVIPSEARDLLFLSTSKRQQIPRAYNAHRNDKLRFLGATSACATNPAILFAYVLRIKIAAKNEGLKSQ